MHIDRDVCTVLDDMERCWESRNFAPLKGLILEARMLKEYVEAAEDAPRRYRVMLPRLVRMKKQYQYLYERIEEIRDACKRAGVEFPSHPDLEKDKVFIPLEDICD